MREYFFILVWRRPHCAGRIRELSMQSQGEKETSKKKKLTKVSFFMWKKDSGYMFFLLFILLIFYFSLCTNYFVGENGHIFYLHIHISQKYHIQFYNRDLMIFHADYSTFYLLCNFQAFDIVYNLFCIRISYHRYFLNLHLVHLQVKFTR